MVMDVMATDAMATALQLQRYGGYHHYGDTAETADEDDLKLDDEEI